MGSYTESIKAAATALEQCEERLSLAKKRASTARGHNGQQGYSVTINGVSVAVSHCDPKTYQGTLIRGREMIHLGVMKVLNEEVHMAEDAVKKATADLLLISARGS